MPFPYSNLLSPRHSQPVLSINLALTGAKHFFSPEKKMRSMETKYQSLLAFVWVLEMCLQRRVGNGSGSAGVTVRVRCWLGHGVPIIFSTPGFLLRDAAL